MPVKPAMLVLMDVWHPFGAAAPKLTDVPCNYVPAYYGGRGATTGPNYVTWDAWVDFDPIYDVRDGLSRSLGSDNLNYSDGDRVDIKNAAGEVMAIYVVTMVTMRYYGYPSKHKRAYLLRSGIDWLKFR